MMDVVGEPRLNGYKKDERRKGGEETYTRNEMVNWVP